MQKIIIAIDGLAATGKSTQAKKLASYLGYRYIDSGAMYRAITFFALQNNWCQDTNNCDEKALIAALPNVKLDFLPDATGKSVLHLNGTNIDNEIRSMTVSKWVSTIAAIPEVRTFLVAQQRAISAQKAIVMDGRDIGTVVFPDAELKFFFTARPEIRAQRRFEELQAIDPDITFQQVLDNVVERDQKDSNRKTSPLIKASDAIEIDVSDQNVSAVFQLLLRYLPTNQ